MNRRCGCHASFVQPLVAASRKDTAPLLSRAIMWANANAAVRPKAVDAYYSGRDSCWRVDELPEDINDADASTCEITMSLSRVGIAPVMIRQGESMLLTSFSRPAAMSGAGWLFVRPACNCP
jgi:hypothetical protein